MAQSRKVLVVTKNRPKKKIENERTKPLRASKNVNKSLIGPARTIKRSVSKKIFRRLPKPNIDATRKIIQKKPLLLQKSRSNPIIAPRREIPWESWQTFNPAAIYEDEKVHLLYRAIGDDGLSVLGYASSSNGIDIDERLNHPAYVPKREKEPSPVRIQGWMQYGSGGGWGGCEDPRMTRIADTVYLMYVNFDGGNPPRIALTSINFEDFLKKNWKWREVQIVSPPGIIDKSGCLFPEKINGKYVIMHRVFPDILIDFVDSLDFSDGNFLEGRYRIKTRDGYWDSRKIGAGAPPIKTKDGWLLIYYGVDDRDASQYKIGAMVLDASDPTKVLHRTDQPILEPVEWYENEGHKAGIAYPCGAAIIDNKLFVYYGGADTVVCVATAELSEFMESLIKDKKPKLTKVGKFLKRYGSRKTI